MRKLLKLFLVLVLLSFPVLGIAADQQELTGAGATFPYPLYSKMFDVYSKEYGVKVNYQAIGSGGGIRQLINKTVDFGGSDAIMGEEEVKAAGAPVLHIPTCAGAVVVTYNLPGSPDIRLTPELMADIFLGKIKKWRRSPHPRCKSRCQAAGYAHHRSPSLRRQRHDEHIQRLPEQGEQGVEREGRRGHGP